MRTHAFILSYVLRTGYIRSCTSALNDPKHDAINTNPSDLIHPIEGDPSSLQPPQKTILHLHLISIHVPTAEYGPAVIRYK